MAAGTATLAVMVIYAFVVLVDPFDTLPLSPPVARVPVASNQRFAYPALARSDRFDSAVFGTSTSRLLRPAQLNTELGGRYVNLAMNDATAYEQTQLMAVFRAAHPAARAVLVGLDMKYCVIGENDEMLTSRVFPLWLYDSGRWRGYLEMFNLYALQEAGQLFGVMTGIKRATLGSDGYTDFLPPDSRYDPVRVAEHIREDGTFTPSGLSNSDPQDWHFPAIERLETALGAFPVSTRKILFFVPYDRKVMPPSGSLGASAWRECKARVAALARRMPNTLAVDFMVPSPITTVDDNYWDAMHYRVGIADRLVRDLAAADRGQASPDYSLLTDDGLASAWH